MTPRLHQLISTSRLTLGGSTTISPRVTTATQQSWHHLSNARGLGYFFNNNLAASIFCYLVVSTLTRLLIYTRLIDFVVSKKLSVLLFCTKGNYHLFLSHPTLGGCAAYIHFTYHRIWASDTACEKESQGKDRKSLFICAGESKIQSI